MLGELGGVLDTALERLALPGPCSIAGRPEQDLGWIGVGKGKDTSNSLHKALIVALRSPGIRAELEFGGPKLS